MNDAYSMVFGTPSLTIAAPGVLANDTDVDGDPLIVGEVNGVPANVGVPITLGSGSTLTVNADGSLTYVPFTTFVGTEFFNYRACENIPAPFLCSNLATVTIKVNAAHQRRSRSPWIIHSATPPRLNSQIVVSENTP